MYKGLLYQHCIRNLYRSIGCLIGPPSKLYEDNQATIKIILADRTTPQVRPLDFVITDPHERHLLIFLKWWTQDLTCNFLTSTLSLMEEKSLGISCLIDRTIRA